MHTKTYRDMLLLLLVVHAQTKVIATTKKIAFRLLLFESRKGFPPLGFTCVKR